MAGKSQTRWAAVTTTGRPSLTTIAYQVRGCTAARPAEPTWVRTSMPAFERVAHVDRVIDVGVDLESCACAPLGNRLVVRRTQLHVGLDHVDAGLGQSLGPRRGLLGAYSPGPGTRAPVSSRRGRG